MILSNREIHAALDAGRLIIEPQPQPRLTTPGQYCPYNTHSVDLTLAPEISIPQPGPYVYDLIANGLAQFIGRNSEKCILDEKQPFPLKPNQFVLGLTREVVGLPVPAGGDTCLAARIEGKSSRARCGVLVHFTAPTVHPGWHGRLTLEMINLGPVPFEVDPKNWTTGIDRKTAGGEPAEEGRGPGGQGCLGSGSIARSSLPRWRSQQSKKCTP
jgi:dCTP deaminase